MSEGVGTDGNDGRVHEWRMRIASKEEPVG